MFELRLVLRSTSSCAIFIDFVLSANRASLCSLFSLVFGSCVRLVTPDTYFQCYLTRSSCVIVKSPASIKEMINERSDFSAIFVRRNHCQKGRVAGLMQKRQ